jgi:hypothetical protein
MKLHKTLQAFDADALADKALEADIREELHAHMEFSIAAGVERGLSAAEAERAAIEQFGDFEQTINACKRAKRGALTMKPMRRSE